MPTINYADLMLEYASTEPSTLDGFTEKLASYCEDIGQRSNMFTYTMWRAHNNGHIKSLYASARDYVRANMSAIVKLSGKSESWITGVAGVVDVILSDIFKMFRKETPYLDKDGSPISPEMIIFTPGSMTHAFTFKGFWQETYKLEERGLKSYDECYEIREELLRMFLTASRDKIRAYQAEIKREMVEEANEGVSPVTVIEVTEVGENLENTLVTLELTEAAFSWLNKLLNTKYGISLDSLE